MVVSRISPSGNEEEEQEQESVFVSRSESVIRVTAASILEAAENTKAAAAAIVGAAAYVKAEDVKDPLAELARLIGEAPEARASAVDRTADEATSRALLIEAAQRTSDLSSLATSELKAAREERQKTERLVDEIAADKVRLEAEIDRLHAEISRSTANFELAQSRQTRAGAAPPVSSVFRSLQFLAGCALAGVVLTGILFGHNVHGFDPGYIGALLGLLTGGGIWAARRL